MTRPCVRMPPVEYGPAGTPVLKLDSNAANADWLGGARLTRHAGADDAQAARELFEPLVCRVE